MVQTFAPDSPAILAAVRHDYGAFARTELPARAAAGYPPFASMVRIVVRGESEAHARALADELGKRLRAKATDGIRVLGPAPAPMTKLRGQYRFQIQLQSADGEALRNVVRAATQDLKTPEDLFWTVDVDPWDMM
jgi:primosomal protein N' (replication factor Y)